VEHGSREELLKEQGLDAESIARRIVEFAGKGGGRSKKKA
jgi:deoxyxylulose-5-phosphate synthase